jgi:hypothetical protein
MLDLDAGAQRATCSFWFFFSLVARTGGCEHVCTVVDVKPQIISPVVKLLPYLTSPNEAVALTGQGNSLS